MWCVQSAVWLSPLRFSTLLYPHGATDISRWSHCPHTHLRRTFMIVIMLMFNVMMSRYLISKHFKTQMTDGFRSAIWLSMPWICMPNTNANIISTMTLLLTRWYHFHSQTMNRVLYWEFEKHLHRKETLMKSEKIHFSQVGIPYSVSYLY